MAALTEQRYAESRGKKQQYVGFEYKGKLVAYNDKLQGGMMLDNVIGKDGTLNIKAVYTDSTHTALSKAHAANSPRIEVICGPMEKTGDNRLSMYDYEGGKDNPRRSFTCWIVAVGDGDTTYNGAVQPLQIRLPKTK